MTDDIKHFKHKHEESFAHDDHVFHTKNLKQKTQAEKFSMDKNHIAENLTAIYENKDGSFPDMKHFQKTKRNKIVRLFFHVIGIGFLSMILALGILYFSDRNNPGGNDVVLSVSGVQNVHIGDSVEFYVDYENPQRVPLSQAVLTVRYPENFVFEKSSVSSTNDTHTEWKLGNLEPHSKGRISIRGRVYGSLNQEQSFRAFFNYLPDNFSSEFQKVATVSFGFQYSPVHLSVKAPESASIGANIPLEVTVVKDFDFQISSMALTLDPANVFIKKSSQPQSDQVSDLFWTLDGKNVTSTFQIQGAFVSEGAVNSSSTPIMLKVVGYVNPQKTGSPLVLGQVQYEPKLIRTALDTKLFINSILTEGMVVPGQNLNTSVVIKNTSQEVMKNVEVALTFEAPSIGRQSILDWNKIEDVHNGTLVGKSLDDTRRQGILTWTSKQVPALANVAPGKEVRLDILVPIKNNPQDAEEYESWNIVAATEIKYEVGAEKKNVSSNSVNLLINSDLTLDVEHEISADSKIHDITWVLKNSYHALKDIELSADIYGDVTFDESQLRVPAGTAKFDATKKSLTWTIPQMPKEVDLHALQFSLKVNSPNPSQKQLTSKVKVRAFDVVTSKEILLAGDEVLVNAGE